MPSCLVAVSETGKLFKIVGCEDYKFIDYGYWEAELVIVV